MLFVLNDDILTIENGDKKQNAGSINYYEREIQFNEKWEGLTIYAIITKEGSTKGTERAVVNNKLYIDQEFNGIYTIGFVGYTIEEGKKNYQISTNLRKIPFGEGAGEIETEEHKLPTPSEWEIYLNQIQQFINEGNEIINQANTLNIEIIQNEKSVNIILTKKDGTTEEHIIYDGKDYILTEEDKQEIIETVTPLIREEIQPTLENNLQEAKDYTDKTKPTKTSELVNDSNFAKTNENNNFSTPQTVNGTLTVNGDIVQNGETYETHAEQLYTEKDEIILRDKAVGGMTQEQFAGLIALLYNGLASGRLGFKADGTAYVGDVGDEQPLLTRDDVLNLIDGQVLIWDGTKLRAIGSSDFIKNTDVASITKAGIAKMWTSTNNDGEIGLNISTEV